MVVSIDVILNTQIQVVGETLITIIRNHDQLGNLDYENSGHTGFASSSELKEFDNKKVSYLTYLAIDIDDVEEVKIQALLEAFTQKLVDYKPGTIYVVNSFGGKSETYSTTFYFDRLCEYTTAMSQVKVYIIESQTAIYRVNKSESFADESTTWSFYKTREKVFSDSDIFRTKANVADVSRLETQLELYTYTRSQIVAEYLADYSTFVGQTVVAPNYTDFDRRTFEFLNKNITKWGWLKEWLIACRTDYETNGARLQLLLEGDETFWAYEMWAFLNKSYRDEYPGSTDYTLENYANGWRPSTTLEKLNDDINELGIRVPNAPLEQGTYLLQVVVDASGKPTYNWKKQ